MTVPGNLSSPLLATAADAAAGAVATKSLRFNSGDSSSLTRTPSSASNRKTWTWAGWIKKGKFGENVRVFSARSGTSGDQTFIQFRTNDKIYVGGNSDVFLVNTDAVFRDPGAWGHLCVSFDTSQSTAADRIRIFWNGVQQDVSGTQPSQDYSTAQINTTLPHAIGGEANSSSEYFNGYLADVYLIDGSRLEPTSFGAYDDNGVWQAVVYSGTYGTNGFHLLDFENESTIGHDSSGNNNDFTANNLTENVLVPNKGFDVVTYTGDGQTTQSITSLAFQPDFVWIKGRNAAAGHVLMDSVRGTGNKVLSSHNTAVEGSETYGQIQSFDSNGFTVEAGSTSAENSNYNNRTYVAWCWKAGGAASSNTDGSITSSVSASSTYGFSIVSWTGTGANATVGHGLSSAPKWVIVKNRSATASWAVWHTALSGSEFFGLNTTNAIQSSSAYWNSSTPTASVINVGTDSSTNGSSNNMIAYCWEEKSGFSKFGSYTGNGSTSGPTVTGLGFKPRFVLIKGDVAGEDWVIVDTERSPTNPNKKLISPNSSSQEFTHSGSAYDMDIDDDGFTVKTTNPRWNTSGETYIWAAFGSGSGNPGDLDVLFDVPTNGDQTDTGAGGEVSGNYATMNSIVKFTSDNVPTFTNGNLKVTGSSATSNTVSTIGTASGKFYFEVTLDAAHDTNSATIGLGQSSVGYSNNKGLKPSGSYNGTITSGSAFSYWIGDTVGIAFEPGVSATFFKNNNEASFVATCLSGDQFAWMQLGGTTVSATFNFGQRPFVNQSVPSNFKALCTTNLPTPTIADGSTAFGALTYSGNSNARTLTGLNMNPDFIWIKSRSSAQKHVLVDSVRTTSTGEYLASDSTQAQGTGVHISGTTDGITIADPNASTIWYNDSSHTYVAWAWDAGSSTVSNTDGSITASVRANQTAGFSIVKYTGKSGGGSWGHGLSAAPDFILFKRYTSAQNWFTWFREADGTYLEFEGINDPRAAFSSRNNVTATSTTITLPNQAEYTNDTSSSYIAYCVSNVSGYSQAGFYDGNGSADGTFVFTNFAVKFLMIKQVNDSNGWFIWDTVRDSLNPNTALFSANATNAEQSQANHAIDFLSNGFKARDSNGAFNSSSGEYAYLAFASNPFQANGGLAR